MSERDLWGYIQIIDANGNSRFIGHSDDEWEKWCRILAEQNEPVPNRPPQKETEEPAP